jgi:DNA-binding LacI/PurR family transcriptional regulator
MANSPRPDAIFCFNDSVAEGCSHALAEMGFSIGEDVALIGYDDSSICEELPVKLASVKFQKYDIGKTAARLLLRMTRGDPVQSEETEILMPELVVRESCGRSKR